MLKINEKVQNSVRNMNFQPSSITCTTAFTSVSIFFHLQIHCRRLAQKKGVDQKPSPSVASKQCCTQTMTELFRPLN